MPTPAPPALTDRAALLRQRGRSRRAGTEFFLHRAAEAEIKERLSEVNRRFTKPAVVAGFGEFWSAAFPDARLVADAPVLDLVPGAHDLVIHAMTLHWADDPVGQLIQCLRALSPDGLFMAVAPGGQTLAELRAALAEAEAALTGGLSPRVLPMAEIRELGGLLQRAGFSLPVADVVPVRVSYATAFHLMAELRAMGEGNALAARARRIPPRRLFQEMALVYSRSYPAPGGRVSASYELMFLTGWAPHPEQPKPLRPGSASHRLAEALGAVERKPDAE